MVGAAPGQAHWEPSRLPPPARWAGAWGGRSGRLEPAVPELSLLGGEEAGVMGLGGGEGGGGEPGCWQAVLLRHRAGRSSSQPVWGSQHRQGCGGTVDAGEEAGPVHAPFFSWSFCSVQFSGPDLAEV